VSNVSLNPKTTDPFPFYDAEVRRLRVHLRSLGDGQWRALSHCAGWSVKDVVAHLSDDEVYNEACLRGDVGELDFSGGLDASNERGVRRRRRLSPTQVREEWERRQQHVRRAWGQIGLKGEIETAGAGRYPLRLQVWHLAREYAIHADDIGVPVPKRSRTGRWRWRIAFGLFAAREEGDSVDAKLIDGEVLLRAGRTQIRLQPETFIAYLSSRPQHLLDPEQRRIVESLL
jgi:uncharacterized protein (TIGR03083 family)